MNVLWNEALVRVGVGSFVHPDRSGIKIWSIRIRKGRISRSWFGVLSGSEDDQIYILWIEMSPHLTGASLPSHTSMSSKINCLQSIHRVCSSCRITPLSIQQEM